MKVILKGSGESTFFTVPEVKRTIAVSLRKLLFDGFIAASNNLNRGNKSNITGENNNYEIERVENSFQTQALSKNAVE